MALLISKNFLQIKFRNYLINYINLIFFLLLLLIKSNYSYATEINNRIINNYDYDKNIENLRNPTQNNLNLSTQPPFTYIGDYSSIDKFRDNLEFNLNETDNLNKVILNNNNNKNNTTELNLEHNLNETEYSNFSNNNDNINHRSKRDINRQDICLVCKCTEGNFINIECDFEKARELDSVFDSKYILPQTAVRLKIILASGTSLRINKGFFQNTARKINNIIIDGTLNNRHTQVEISTNAFKRENIGPFPAISINNVDTVFLRSESFGGDFKLNISNSDYVMIYENAFKDTKFEGFFDKINDLNIKEKAFDKVERAKLNIQFSNIKSLDRFEASLREVRFYNCSIDTINTGTFDVLAIDSIIFEKCKINTFKTKAITEKLFSPKLRITDGEIGTIESDAISGSGITELFLSHNHIDTIQDNAIYVTSVNATIMHNKINHLGLNWLRVKEFSTMLITRNHFGNFDKFDLNNSKNLISCKFEYNFITNPKPNSLNIGNRLCSIHEISFYENCNCNTTWLDKLSTRDLKTESYCRVDDLEYCLNTTLFNVKKYLEEVCDMDKTELDCWKNSQLKKIHGEFLKPEDLENDSNEKLQLVYLLSGVGLLLILAIIIFITAIKCISARNKSTSTMPLTDSSNAPVTSTPNGTVQKEHPQLKLFSAEDRRIINQTLECMEQKYPPHVFDEVERNTQILLRGNITEMQRVKAIGDIVQILDEECPNAGEDFVAFTDILYRHLASSSGTAPPIEPTYAEPALPQRNNHQINNNIGPYATASAINVPRPQSNGQTNIDHIYAEPTSVQPLLTNEYASPLDRSEMVDLYSEPIGNDKDRKIITPYAIINPPGLISSKKLQPTQNPSTSTNLPDVLNQSNINNTNHNNNNNNKMLTNVQKMAQSFANDPNFHITRSPNSNRRIPKYTIPNSNKSKLNLDNNNTHIDGGAVSYLPQAGSSNINNNLHLDNRSNHSGGSDITVQIDDIIEYADA